MTTVAELTAILRANTSDFKRGMVEAGQVMDRQEQKWSKLGATSRKASREIQASIGAIGVAAVGLGTSLVAVGVSYNVLLQKTTAAFTTVLGSADAAREMIGDLEEFARTSPFPRQVFIESTQELIGFGIAARNVIPIFGALEDAVAATGGGVQEIRQYVNVFAQIKSAGRAYTETLMRFSSAGIDAFALLAKESGKSISQVRKLVSEGGFGADETISMLTAGLSKKFEGAAEGVKATWIGAKDRIAGAWRDIGSVLAAPFIDPNGGGVAVEFANNLADLLRKQVLPAVQSLGPKLKEMVAPIRDFGVMIGKFDLDDFFDKFKDWLPVIKQVAPALGAMMVPLSGMALMQIPFLNQLLQIVPLLSTLTGPWGIIVAGIVGVIAASEKMRTQFAGIIDQVGAMVAGIMPALILIFSNLTEVIENLLPVVLDLVGNFLDAFGPALVQLAAVAAAFSEALVFVSDNLGVILVALAAVLGPILALNAGFLGLSAVATGTVAALGPVGVAIVGLTAAIGALNHVNSQFVKGGQEAAATWLKVNDIDFGGPAEDFARNMDAVRARIAELEKVADAPLWKKGWQLINPKAPNDIKRAAEELAALQNIVVPINDEFNNYMDTMNAIGTGNISKPMKDQLGWLASLDSKHLQEFAASMGITKDKLGDLDSAVPLLAKFGEQAKETGADLAWMSKNTGIAIGDLRRFFDTVGKPSLAFGGLATLKEQAAALFNLGEEVAMRTDQMQKAFASLANPGAAYSAAIGRAESLAKETADSIKRNDGIIADSIADLEKITKKRIEFQNKPPAGGWGNTAEELNEQIAERKRITDEFKAEERKAAEEIAAARTENAKLLKVKKVNIFDEFNKNLFEQIKTMRSFKANLTKLVRSGFGDIAGELLLMDPQAGAALAAEAVGRSFGDLKRLSENFELQGELSGAGFLEGLSSELETLEQLGLDKGRGGSLALSKALGMTPAQLEELRAKTGGEFHKVVGELSAIATSEGGLAAAELVRVLGETLPAAQQMWMDYEEIALASLNKVRAAAGLPPVLSSRQEAAQMARRGRFNAHTQSFVGSNSSFVTMDRGGWLPPGFSTVYNGTGAPERILGPGESADGGNTVQYVTVQTMADPGAVIEALNRRQRTTGTLPVYSRRGRR